MPPELAAALAADPVATAAWDALAPSHRRDYAEHVAEAKQPATRERRAAKTVETLRRLACAGRRDARVGATPTALDDRDGLRAAGDLEL